MKEHLHALNEVDAREHGQRAVAMIITETAAEAQRIRSDDAMGQRHLDEAMADVVEIVRRHRTRMGRRVCSVPDGKMVRDIFALLKGMAGQEVTADNDPSWGER